MLAPCYMQCVKPVACSAHSTRTRPDILCSIGTLGYGVHAAWNRPGPVCWFQYAPDLDWPGQAYRVAAAGCHAVLGLTHAPCAERAVAVVPTLTLTLSLGWGQSQSLSRCLLPHRIHKSKTRGFLCFPPPTPCWMGKNTLICIQINTIYTKSEGGHLQVQYYETMLKRSVAALDEL